MTFFSSVSLALANLLYDIRCPAIVKRFASRNDLYSEMLRIKQLSAAIYPDDKFDGSLDHCTKAYSREASSFPWSRLTCTWMFILSGALFLIVLTYRVYLMLRFAFGMDP